MLRVTLYFITDIIYLYQSVWRITLLKNKNKKRIELQNISREKEKFGGVSPQKKKERKRKQERKKR
jgi:hypothetical protein